MMVSSAATVVRSNSLPRKENTPTVMNTSWMSATTAPRA